eukprot:c7899_g1_i1.p1 GENE.c7899_g1_i1~~c7899_g1_i1.p1  ORF type:complete len:696 (-),score=253.54 c7899_g1_i1:48-2057(-)
MPEVEESHGMDMNAPEEQPAEPFELPEDMQLDAPNDVEENQPEDVPNLDEPTETPEESKEDINDGEEQIDPQAEEQQPNETDEQMSAPAATKDEAATAEATEQGPGTDSVQDLDQNNATPPSEKPVDTTQDTMGKDESTGNSGNAAPSASQDGTTDPNATNTDTTPTQPEKRVPQPSKPKPNPFRSLGDATKDWKKRLNMTENDENKASDETSEAQPQDGDQQDKQAQEFEFVKDQENSNNQTMAEATDEQAKQSTLPEQNEEATDLNDSGMDVSEDDLLKQQQLESEEKKKSNDRSKAMGKGAEGHRQEKDQEEVIDPAVASEKQATESRTFGEQPNQPEEWLGRTQRADEIRRMQIEQSDENENENTEMDNHIEDESNLNEQDKPSTTQSEASWSAIKSKTVELSANLCEQLRLLLEPMVCSKMQGDYKTGKRINMKKVIPYIASGFKRDKIWLRRTKPNKRDYNILVAVDDSASMRENGAHEFALQAMAVLCQAMERLEVGEVGLMSFGKTPKMVLPFGTPFTDETAQNVVNQLEFTSTGTRLTDAVSFASKQLDQQKMHGQFNADQYQLVFVICDGGHSETAKELLPVAHKALAEQKLFCFIVLDDTEHQDSILNRKFVDYSGGLKIIPYLDWFPFPYYMLLSDIRLLPDCLADALKQWFDLVQQ